MSITQQHVDYVAHLSRLALSEDEKERFAQQLDEILDAVDKLNELNTEGVEPLVHMGPERNVTREDTERSSLSRENVLSNAPDQAKHCFKVPQILD
jgi:aspartyl-tRNA(Asn)/glutamyl-tRNA(Gln) amidotransferase subunit C